MYYVENAHEPIITTETFEKVQAISAEMAAKYAPKTIKVKTVYPFTSLIRCANCGKHFTRKKVRTGFVWICPTFNHIGKSACASKQIPEKTLEEEIKNIDMKQVAEITACDGNLLIFHFLNGSEERKKWSDRSRTTSWTEEMRDKAKKQTKARDQ